MSSGRAVHGHESLMGSAARQRHGRSALAVAASVSPSVEAPSGTNIGRHGPGAAGIHQGVSGPGGWPGILDNYARSPREPDDLVHDGPRFRHALA
jgi:hypothetical protein